MNILAVGSNKQSLLPFVEFPCLVIDDGDFIDALDVPQRKSVIHFDTDTHSFNPLKDMTYLKARQFWNVLKAAFPEGENTLTKANAEFQILSALSEMPRKLDRLISDTKDTQYAYQLIQKLLLSDTLTKVLTRPTNFSFKGTIIARLDRAVLGDFDCFVLANLLISQFQGAIVVPDFGFYATPAHASLIRQNRLIAGVTAFDEVPALKSQLLQIEEKHGSRCTPDDAKTLALYEGIPPGTNAYNDFIAASIR